MLTLPPPKKKMETSIHLTALLWLPPITLLRMCLVCKRWNEEFKKDMYWFRHREYVLQQLPLLRAEFEYIPDTSAGKRIPVWQAFVRRLWPLVRNEDVFAKLFYQHTGHHIQASVVAAGHKNAKRIRIVDRCQIHYENGKTIGYNIRLVSNSETVNFRMYLITKQMRRMSDSKGDEFSYFKCTTFYGAPWSKKREARIISMYGPYKDIVKCNPKGVRFRNLAGSVDASLKYNPLYPEDE